jgi:hypothetical protein
MLYTTLKLLRKNSACLSGMDTLIASLPKTQTAEKQISLAHILKSNGLDHALWALRATTVDARKYAARMSIDFALECLANFEKAYPDDTRPRSAIEAAGLFLDGKITLQELETAWSAAESAVWSVESAAWSAAESAVWSVESAVESAVWSAVWSAAESAVWSAWFAARSAAQERNAEIFLKWVRKAKS